MKRASILIAILLICSIGKSQNETSVLFTGNYVYQPSLELKGAGYTLALQKNIQNWIFLEGGVSYTIASANKPRNEILSAVQLLDLNYHSAAYNFYMAPAAKIYIGSKLGIDLYAGPIVSYQSNLIDVYHYRILEETDFMHNYPDVIYSNKSQEGLFFGGIAGARCSLLLGNHWAFNAGVSVKGIIQAESSVNMSLGFSYNWE